MARVLTPSTLEAIESLCGRYPSRLAALLPARRAARLDVLQAVASV